MLALLERFAPYILAIAVALALIVIGACIGGIEAEIGDVDENEH